MRILLRSALLLALSVLPLSQTWAGEVLDRIAKTETLRVGMSGSQPPFNVHNRDGDLIGMEVDIANLLAGAMNVKLEIVEKPFTAANLRKLVDERVNLRQSAISGARNE